MTRRGAAQEAAVFVHAIILCGGKGTRLSRLYADRPKALVPIAGRPFIEWQLDWLLGSGVCRRVHLAAGHLAPALQDWLQASAYAAACTLSAEPAPLGTAGALKFAEPFVQSDPFLAVNGDTLVPNLRIDALAAAHAAGSRMLTLAVTPIENAGRYGTVEFDAQGRLTAFREKAEHRHGWINGGVYIAARSLFDRIPPERNVSLETDVFPALAAQGLIATFRAEPPLLDMGTPSGIEQMESCLRRQGA